MDMTATMTPCAATTAAKASIADGDERTARNPERMVPLAGRRALACVAACLGRQPPGQQQGVRAEARKQQDGCKEQAGGREDEGTGNRRQPECLPYHCTGLDQVGSGDSANGDGPHHGGQ